MGMPMPLVHCENLVKIYKVADLEVVALQGLDLDVMSGEMVALMGASGSGKSTLMNVLGGLDVPSAGLCQVASYDMAQLTPAQRLRYRRTVIGYVRQQGGRNLIAHLTLAENLDVPQLARGIPSRERRRRVGEVLEAVGLGDMAQKQPSRLSGGEQQRAGIAVAIAHRPEVLLADEPTGELDSITAQQILDLFRAVQRAFALTIILVTHDPQVAERADRVISLRDGRTSTETRRRLGARADDDTSSPDTVSLLTGLSTATHDELIVVDRVGRLQLPREVMEALGITGRVKLHRAGDHVELWPYHEQPDAPEKEEM
jgi:ABC-type lipoprotein export system ATPase subunit